MLKGNGVLVDNRIAEIKSNLETVEERAHAEAVNVAAQNSWNEELTNLFKDFLLKNDPRFNTAELTKELDYIETHFCEDVEVPVENNEI